jgi:hypothetical protein
MGGKKGSRGDAEGIADRARAPRLPAWIFADDLHGAIA